MMALCRTRFKIFCLLIYLVNGDLADGVEEGKEWSDRGSGGSRLLYVCCRFGVRSFRSIKGFNGDHFGPRESGDNRTSTASSRGDSYC
jgi:hypothetical protein